MNFSEAFSIIIATSIFFVWVIRYDNIIKEFKEYGLPTWLRDLVGILKLSFAVMLVSNTEGLKLIGSLGIASLMIAAILTHIKIKNPVYKILPSTALLLLSSFVFLQKV